MGSTLLALLSLALVIASCAAVALGDPPGPTSFVQPIASPKTRATFPVWATASGGLGGVAALELWFQRDGGPWTRYGDPIPWPWSWQFNSSAAGGDGSYGFYSIALDAAGNREAPPEGPDAVVLVDTTKPTSGLDPLPPYTTSPTFGLTAWASDAGGIAKVDLYVSRTGARGSYRWASSAFTPAGNRYGFAFSAEAAGAEGGQGPFYFLTRAQDRAGNYEAEPPAPGASTVVDTRPPSASFTTALGPYAPSSTIAVEGRVADANGLAAVELWYRRDGGPWALYGPATPDAAGAVAWALDTAAAGGDGPLALMIVATDAAGNRVAVEGPTTVVDTHPPTLAITTPHPGGVEGSGTVTIAWAAADATSGIDHYEVSLDGGPFVDVGLNVKELLRDLPRGPHGAVVRAYDRAGNVAEARVEYTVAPGPAAAALGLALPLVVALGALGAAFGLLVRRRRRRGRASAPPP